MENIKILNQTIKDSFSEIWKHLEDENVTDFDFNCENIWLSTVSSLPKKIDEPEIDTAYMENFANYIGRMEGSNFNEVENTVFAASETLRITCIHKSQSKSGLTVCIRKFGEQPRLTADNAVEEGYCDKKSLNMLRNLVKARFSFFIGGLPGNGKTETIKLLSSFIPEYEKVITIEDVPEINYQVIHPGANSTELKVVNGNYKACLEKMLRMNARWTLFGEVRGSEVQFLLECMSNGIPFMTTGHVGDARNVPDRILNMLNDRRDSERIVNQLHTDIGVSLLIEKKVDGDGNVYRYLDQLCFYDRNEDSNVKALVIDKGKLDEKQLPVYLRKKIEKIIGGDLFSE